MPEKNYTGELFALIKQHPNLPIVPMVDSEIVGDNCGRWLGAWGFASVDRYYNGEERVYFYDEYDTEDLLAEVMGWEWLEAASDTMALATYKALPWVECIVVNIDLP